jgi:phospho-N-acetylmuramoyl-pentapeptide-transferase
LQALLGLFVALYLFCPAVSSSLHVGKWFAPPVAKEQVALVKNIEGKMEYGGTSLSTQGYAARYFVPFLKDPVVILKGAGILFGILFTVCVITGSSNAVNLTDGLDGLASGCVVMAAGVLGLFAFLSNNLEMSRYLNILYIEESGEIAVYLFALIGACLGFLWYNGYPAQVFMGDTGSLALGGILGVCAVLLRREVLFAIVGGIFVVETLSVILQVASYKFRHKKRIFLCSPLHHHFEYLGWSETKVVLRFWIVGLILAIFGIASLKLQ